MVAFLQGGWRERVGLRARGVGQRLQMIGRQPRGGDAQGDRRLAWGGAAEQCRGAGRRQDQHRLSDDSAAECRKPGVGGRFCGQHDQARRGRRGRLREGRRNAGQGETALAKKERHRQPGSRI